MASSSILDFRVLIVPGLHGSGPHHWQSRWQRLYPYFERVEQDHWDRPDLDAWSQRLDQVIRRSSQPMLLAAHSFGCLASVDRLARGAPGVCGALLVAPADPEKFGVAGRLRDVKLPTSAILVGSSNDPWMTAGQAARWSERWGAEFLHAGALGHINADSELGDWQHGLSLLRRLAAAVPAHGYLHAKCQLLPRNHFLRTGI